MLCLCFVLGSILFLSDMGLQYTKDNLVLLDNAALQHEVALIKQTEGDLQTLHGVAVFVGQQDTMELDQLIALVGEVNEGNAFIRMGFANLSGRLELIELGGKRYQGRTSFPGRCRTRTGRSSSSTTTPCRSEVKQAPSWACSAR